MSKFILFLENQEPINNPTVENIQSALDKLDGEKYTMMELTNVNNGTLMAIGGNGGKIMVTYIPDNFDDKSPSLRDTKLRNTGDCSLTFEGETMEYPGEFCIAKDLAVKAFNSFLISGKLDKELDWAEA